MSTPLSEIVEHLDVYLKTATVPDYSSAHNGLQVESDGPVSRVVVAVDACQTTIDYAVSTNADLVIVHHGLFWDGDVAVTGRRWRRLRALVMNGIALYASHLPLDCHEVVGNNVLLANLIGLRDQEPFGDFQGTMIARTGRWAGSREDLVAKVEGATGNVPQLIAAGPEKIQQVAVLTGAGGSMIREAKDAGADTLVTGEGAHHTFFDAEEAGMNVLYAGHYATEVFGVKALGQHLQERFDVGAEFFDHPTGL